MRSFRLTCTGPAFGERYGGCYRSLARQSRAGRADELDARAIAPLWILGHRPGDHGVEGARNLRAFGARGGRFLVHVGPHQLQLALTRERGLAREALVEDAAQRVLVRPAVEGLAPDLLRGEIVG